MDDTKSYKLKDIIQQALSIAGDTAPNKEIRRRLFSAGEVTGTNLCMMICAIIIACVGLNSGSLTAVIGAMLIEPLMGSILMCAYTTISADSKNFKVYSLGFLAQIIFSITASTIYFLITPFKEPTQEILSLTQPSLFEVVVAFFGGIAGIIGQTRKEKVNTIIPGVAIATSLIPPLCVCGYAIARLDLSMLLGAAYMFFVNAYFIALGASIVLSLFKIPKTDEMSDIEWKKLKWEMIRNTLLFLIPAVLATIYRLVK